MSGPTTGHDADLHAHCPPLRAHTRQESLALNDRFIFVCQLAGFSPSFPGRRPAQHATLELDFSTQPHNDWSIGPRPTAPLIGGRGLLSTKLQDLTLMCQSLGRETDANATPAFPTAPLGNRAVGRHRSRHPPASPTPNMQRNTSSCP